MVLGVYVVSCVCWADTLSWVLYTTDSYRSIKGIYPVCWPKRPSASTGKHFFHWYSLLTLIQSIWSFVMIFFYELKMVYGIPNPEFSIMNFVPHLSQNDTGETAIFIPQTAFKFSVINITQIVHIQLSFSSLLWNFKIQKPKGKLKPLSLWVCNVTWLKPSIAIRFLPFFKVSRSFMVW